jgi:prepilin-type N-terminal cleavage/methylation domain-containing protein
LRNFNKIKGFTLAEVLITLLIKGVVASIVIPGLIADTQQAEYKASYKKICSTLNNAAKMLATDNGGSLAGLFSTHDTMRNTFLPYLSYAKICNAGASNGICHPLETSYKTYYGTSFPIVGSWDAMNGLSIVVLNDGTILGFFIVDGNCSSSRLTDNTECGLSSARR